MNQYIEVMKRTTELADTCLEGLEYVKKKLNEGHSESTMLLFHYVPGKGSARVNPGTAEFGPCGQRDSALQRGAEAVHQEDQEVLRRRRRLTGHPRRS